MTSLFADATRVQPSRTPVIVSRIRRPSDYVDPFRVGCTMLVPWNGNNTFLRLRRVSY